MIATSSRHRHANRGAWTKAIVFPVALLIPIFAAAQTQSGEYQVKAAFIFHFAEMVEWPSSVLGSDNSPLVICTLGHSYSAVLDGAATGKQIGSHPVGIRHLRSDTEVAGCHLLVISDKNTKQAEAILAGVKGIPMLTVGDAENFAANGGMIGMFLQDDKICFDVNLDAAQRANLKISARLLVLARTVIGSGKQG
jgi:hypothetical protein